ncbi:MAG: tetratricopeptide repeat protein [Deltaproteobacteria bacterium]|nr:tetratricopeptide repeat protein [Deltaproteobacteria bacterium]
MLTKTIALMSITLALTLGSVNVSHANTREQARAAFMQGRVAFKAGRFAEAAKHLSEAYRLKPHPALLRYLGQSYLKLGQASLAIKKFELYLKEAPSAPDAKKIRIRVAKLKRALAKAAKGKKAGEPAKPLDAKLIPTGEDNEIPDVMGKPMAKEGEEAEEPDGSSGRWVTYGKWTSAALGVGGLAAGMVFNILASGKASELEDAAKSTNPDLNQPTTPYSAEHFSLQQDYKRFNTMAVVSYIVGGVFSAAAVTLFVLDRGNDTQEQARKTAFVPWLGPQSCGLAATVVF